MNKTAFDLLSKVMDNEKWQKTISDHTLRGEGYVTYCPLGLLCHVSRLGQWRQVRGGWVYVCAGEERGWSVLPNKVARWAGTVDIGPRFKLDYSRIPVELHPLLINRWGEQVKTATLPYLSDSTLLSIKQIATIFKLHEDQIVKENNS